MSTDSLGGQHERTLLHGELSRKVVAAFYAVHFEMGSGHTESVYSASIAIALKDMGVAAEREVPLAVYFRGIRVGSFRADLVVEKKILLELKAGPRLEATAEPQLLNYLRVTDVELGLLLHFGPKAVFKRYLMTNDRKSLRVPPSDSVYSV